MGNTSFYPTRAEKPNPATIKPKPAVTINPMFKQLAWKILDFKNHCDPEEWNTNNIARIIQEWSDEEL